ncbi:hypothetical protein V9R53_003701 [Vibrio mimicus]
MKRKKEQSVIDGFFNYLRRRVEDRERKFVKCSMDGMDSVLGADYIFSDNTHFLLTEFKFDVSDLIKEAEKHRRLNLCQNLDLDDLKAQKSLQCHYIAWSKKIPDNKRRIYFNQYKPEICNQTIFGADSSLYNIQPDDRMQKTANIIIDEFLEHKIGASFQLFDDYVSWLISLEGDQGDSGVEILIDDPESDECDLQGFDSLKELKEWLDKHSPKPEIKPDPEPKPKKPKGPEDDNSGPSFGM